MSRAGTSEQGAVIVARGARAVEALVLDELGELAGAARRDPALLALPVVVVVPSRSLRLHLAARLVAAHGAVAGVSIVTLHRLAHDILAAAGEPSPRGEVLVPVLVRRAARRHPALATFLEPLADGYTGIGGPVRDLLDAGLEAAHADALDERLAELDRGGSDAGVARARAIVRVAAAVQETLEDLGLGRRSTLLRRAAELVLDRPERALPARAVLVHGFAEATGVATDLLEALVRRRGARVFVDLPPDPTEPGAADLGVEFARRLRERLAGYVPEIDRSAGETPAPQGTQKESAGKMPAPHETQKESAGETPAPQETQKEGAGEAPAPRDAGDLVMRRAPGTFAEVRAVAGDVRTLLDRGVRPEAIGIVARDLGRVQHALHQHLGRLCIPYSSAGAPGLRGPASRRVEALAELLLAGPEASVDAWLDATLGLGGHRAGDLRLALRVLGALAVSEVAALRVAERLGGAGALPLPVRRGLDAVEPEEDEAAPAPPEGEGEERGARATRRSLHSDRLERAAADARAWCRGWAALPERGPMPVFAAALLRLVDEVVRWRPLPPDGASNAAERDAPRAALRALAAELPADLALERDEALALVCEALREAGREMPGGAGAGVQVLGVVEARARTFEHLFVVGLNRDVFPRVVREDWLLPDRLRAALLPLLPDMPLKRTGNDEERYLFAQLVAAAPHVTVSWTECDDDGKPTPASPLVERLRAGDPERAPLLADLYAGGGVGDRAVRPPHEHAVLAGLSGDRGRFAAVLPVALSGAGIPPAPATEEERGRDARATREAAGACGAGILPALDSRAVAAARAAVLAELDPDRHSAEGRRRAMLPGPYMGFIGAAPTRGTDTGGGAAPMRGTDTGGGAAAGEGLDPRGGRLWVTELERLAACPWQTFLRRLLRLEPVPDGGGELPALTGAIVGSVVHAALERIARPSVGDGPATLAEAAAGAARTVQWPAAPALDEMLAAAAEAVLHEEGMALPLLVRGAAERARPFLDAAHAADFAGEEPVAVAGVEVEGDAPVVDRTGRERRVAFRADRVDARGGALRLTDYKTGGRTITTSGKPDQKRKRLLQFVASGQYLQAAAYAAAGGAGAAGRYLFLQPELADAARSIVADADAELLETFRRAAADLLALRDAGVFFPRLVNGDGRKEGPACRTCDLREACLVGDTGARRRLRAWVGAQGGANGAAGQVAAAARVWRLGESDGAGEGGA